MPKADAAHVQDFNPISDTLLRNSLLGWLLFFLVACRNITDEDLVHRFLASTPRALP